MYVNKRLPRSFRGMCSTFDPPSPFCNHAKRLRADNPMWGFGHLTEDDQRFMEQAIAMAEQCRPLADRIPKVGAVIVANGVVIGKGSRGSGNAGDDDHAEWNALEKVPDRRELTNATVYTTLEAHPESPFRENRASETKGL